MSAILPPYTGESARCVHRGHRRAVVGYTPDGEPCGRLSRLQAVDTVERLCRSCELCGYHWDEATVDAEKPAEEPCEQSETACARCHGRGHVPDFSNGLDPVYGEPKKKPCPACQGDRPAPEPYTDRCEARCLSQWKTQADGIVQCARAVGHEGLHHDELTTSLPGWPDPRPTWQWTTGDQL